VRLLAWALLALELVWPDTSGGYTTCSLCGEELHEDEADGHRCECAGCGQGIPAGELDAHAGCR
jgi:hypothetical protein